MCLVNKTVFLTRINIKYINHGRSFCNNFFQKQNLRVLFFGTENFSLPSLQMLTKNFKANSTLKDLAVVTSMKIPANHVQKFAQSEQIEVFNWPFDNYKNNYDIGVVVSFGYLIPDKLIKSFPLGMINLHASLLPKWRGAAPIIYAILNGDTKTGVSIMKIRPYLFDTGDILMKKEIIIPPKILMPDLHKLLADEGSKLLLYCITNISTSLSNAKCQSQEGISYAPKVQNSLTIIDWKNMTAMNIFNLYRALYSYKLIKTNFNGQVIKFVEIDYDSLTKCNHVCQPGTISYSKKDQYLKVYCINGEHIKIYKLQVEGKKVMSILEFANGFLKKVPTELHCFK